MDECGGEFAGTFYPRRASERRAMIESWELDRGPVAGPVHGLLLPHAGWVYSGECAMRALRAAGGMRPSTVVHLGPSHRTPLEGAVLLDADRVRFGDASLPVDRALGDRLAESVEEVGWADPFPEHSLEVQWPMLAAQWPEVSVLPVVVGRAGPDFLVRLGEALHPLAREGDTLLVASSDLSHFHDHDEADRLDALFERRLVEGDPDRLTADLSERRTEACGWAPVLASLQFARRRGARWSVVDRRDSSWASGDVREVVGYLSAVLTSGDEAAA